MATGLGPRSVQVSLRLPPAPGFMDSQELVPTLSLPNRGAKRAASADEDLNKMLEEGEELAPAWAVAMNAGIMNRFSRIEHATEEFGARLAMLEQKSVDDGVKVKAMEEQLQVMQKTIEELQKQPSVQGPPTDPWANFKRVPPPANLNSISTVSTASVVGGDETDFGHLILGGWAADTKRQVIEAEWSDFLKHFPLPDVTRTAVYGKRGRVAHCYLRHLDIQASRDRFFRLLPEVNKKFRLSSGEYLWISPNKPLSVRMRNKALSVGLHRLLKVCRMQADSDQVEVDWYQGLVWLCDRRMLALAERGLLAQPEEKLLEICIRLDARDRAWDQKCYYNLTALGNLTRINAPDLEVALLSD